MYNTTCKIYLLLWIIVKILDNSDPQNSQELQVRINLWKVILNCDS
jgi:hypothetical protein